jgi:hypothetical protein
MDALERNKTWDLVELPNYRKVFGCKWVYKLKKGVDDKVERYKARLVEKGYSQKEGIDFHEIFSLVVKIASVRVVLSIVALLDIELDKLDVKTMFLHGGEITKVGYTFVTIRSPEFRKTFFRPN